MQSIDLIRDNLNASRDRVMARCREARASTLALLDALAEDDLDRVSAKVPAGFESTFGTCRQALQYVADHWYMHRGQLADARRAAGRERMWVQWRDAPTRDYRGGLAPPALPPRRP